MGTNPRAHAPRRWRSFIWGLLCGGGNSGRLGRAALLAGLFGLLLLSRSHADEPPPPPPPDTDTPPDGPSFPAFKLYADDPNAEKYEDLRDFPAPPRTEAERQPGYELSIERAKELGTDTKAHVDAIREFGLSQTRQEMLHAYAEHARQAAEDARVRQASNDAGLNNIAVTGVPR